MKWVYNARPSEQGQCINEQGRRNLHHPSV